MASELDKSIPEALRLIADFKHIGYESVPKSVPRKISSSSLKTCGASAPEFTRTTWPHRWALTYYSLS